MTYRARIAGRILLVYLRVVLGEHRHSKSDRDLRFESRLWRIAGERSLADAIDSALRSESR